MSFNTPHDRTQTENGNSIAWDHRSDQTKVQTVYFDLVTIPAMPDARSRINIGQTGNHDKRREQHEKSKHGVEFSVHHLCVVRGTYADEQKVLRYFRPCRLDNELEVFWPEPELVEYIRWLRDEWYVWTPDDPHCESVDKLELVEASRWTPNTERRKPPPVQTDLLGDNGPLNLPPREYTVDDFFTGEPIINAARKCLGWIDLDPASHPVANRVIKATRFYTPCQNGLIKEWAGRVWLNPPFSEWELWVSKIVEEWSSGRITGMCILCATRTLTARYLGPIHDTCSGLCILHGRIPFWGARAGSPDDGHAIFYFGKNTERFRETFGTIGKVYVKVGEGEG